MRACVFVVMGIVACSREAPPPAAAVDLVVPPIAGSASPASSAPGPPRRDPNDTGCSVKLVTGPIEKSSPTCYLDQEVENGGTLHYPCSGSGPVEAAFGALRYAGRLRDGEVELEARTELDWDGDGCRWGTVGIIRGTLAKKKLEWTYADRVVRGTGCSGVCRASASFDVHE